MIARGHQAHHLFLNTCSQLAEIGEEIRLQLSRHGCPHFPPPESIDAPELHRCLNLIVLVTHLNHKNSPLVLLCNRELLQSALRGGAFCSICPCAKGDKNFAALEVLCNLTTPSRSGWDVERRQRWECPLTRNGSSPHEPPCQPLQL